MEIRIENTIPIEWIENLKHIFDTYFNTDFIIDIDGDYVYYRGGK